MSELTAGAGRQLVGAVSVVFALDGNGALQLVPQIVVAPAHAQEIARALRQIATRIESMGSPLLRVPPGGGIVA